MRYAAMIGILALAFLSAVQVSNAGTVASESAAISTAAISSPSSELLLPVTPAPIMTYQGTFSI